MKLYEIIKRWGPLAVAFAVAMTVAWISILFAEKIYALPSAAERDFLFGIRVTRNLIYATVIFMIYLGVKIARQL